MIAHHEPHAANFDTVNNDDRPAARRVVEHLVATGRKKIAFLSLDLSYLGDVSVTGQREAGYRAAMCDAGLGKHRHVMFAGQTSRDLEALRKRSRYAESAKPAWFWYQSENARVPAKFCVVAR